MSLFENVGFLCGNFRAENFKESIQKFLALSDDVKDSLRENSYLLSEYLFTIFKSLDCTDISMATDRAENLCSEAVSVCRSILSKEENEKLQSSPFYSKAVEFIKNNPVSYDKYDTKTYFYVASILINNIESISKDFTSDVKNKILSKVNYGTVNENYKNIIDIVDKDKIDYLNNLLDEIFIISPIIMIFMQAIMLKIVNMMVYENPESKKKVFELMIEGQNQMKRLDDNKQ